MTPARNLLLIGGLLFAAHTPVGAADVVSPAPAPAASGEIAASSFEDAIHTYLVNVEVWVSDGRGRPITGLTVDDFELFEDGEPVKATHFASMSGSEAATTALSLESGVAGEVAAKPPAETPDPGYMVLYFDLLHLSAAGSRQIVRDLGGFLDSGSLPASRIMVLAQDRDLSTIVPFGSTRKEIDGALEKLATVRPEGDQVERDKRLTLKRLQQTWDVDKDLPGDPCRLFVPTAIAEVEAYAWQRTELITTTLDFLADVAGYLSALPGLKTLVYLGDQLETTPGRGLLSFVDVLCPPNRRDDLGLQLTSDLVEPFDRLTAHANTNRVTFYAFQTGGLKPNLLTSADMASTSVLNNGGRIDGALRTNERAGLSYLATQTGGRTAFSRNRFEKELVSVAEEMVGYYSLAYVPLHGGDGKVHRIDVKVRESAAEAASGRRVGNLIVRHRKGYRDKGDEMRMSERIEAVAHLGLVSNPLEVRLGAGAIEPQEGGRYRLPLHVMIQAARATFLPRAGAPGAAQLELVATAYDPLDHVVSSTRSTFQIDEPAAGEDTTLDLVAQVDIGPGRHVVVVGLIDQVSQEASYVSTAIEVASP
jgi:VWFA-related protein